MNANSPQPINRDLADTTLRVLENRTLDFIADVKAEIDAAQDGRQAFTVVRAKQIVGCVTEVEAKAQEIEDRIPNEWLSPLYFELRDQLERLRLVLQRLIAEAVENPG
jgi:hypothetical protein